MLRHLLVFAAVLGIASCTTASAPAPAPTGDAPPPAPQVGILVMAHGGTAAWDSAVRDLVEPLATEVPTEIAFGMADPVTLTSGLANLRAHGVDRVAVVRLFLSGGSFLHQTEYLLGLRPDRPDWFVGHGGAMHPDPEPIPHGMALATHRDGLSDWPMLGDVVADRARNARAGPEEASILLLAHGVGDDAENDRLLERMRAATRDLPVDAYQEVRVATLREDWPDKRAVAEREIRAFVTAEAERGRDVVVIPFRLFGMGPYPEVLEGLDYTATSALLPHEAVATWVRRTAWGVACGQGWSTPLGPCAAIADPAERSETR